MARSVWKKGNDLVNKIPTPGYTPKSDPQKQTGADPGMVDAANKSFIHSTQTAAQKKSAPAPSSGKITIKSAQRKR